MKKTVVISAVNLRKGGTLAILRQYLASYASREDIRTVALVHDRRLCECPGVDYIEMPWCTRSWFHRLWAEYVSMMGVSRRIAAEDGRKVWLWISLHDTTPRVEAEHQEVYCHTSFPFLRVQARDWLMDPKIPLFALLTKFAYRINVRRNDALIVQQRWFADALSRLTGFPREKFRVEAPSAGDFSACGTAARSASDELVFLYVATADCHKNFETLCRAAALLEADGYEFRVVLTIDGTENRYAKWIKSRWGSVKSIDFHGFMTRDELVRAYSGATCFVCPSRVETWCLPITEYRSVNPSGRLLLADLPYAHETSGGDAVFFDVCDAAGLECRMREILIEGLL